MIRLVLKRSEAMHTEDPAKGMSSSIEETTGFSGAGTPRSSSIPLPRSHVARTDSEVQLSSDQAAAEQREIDMFYRLVQGIRNRQAGSHIQEASRRPPLHHPPSALQPSRVIDESPPLAFYNAFGWPVESGPSMFLQQSQGPVVDTADSWSITGFDGPASHDPFSPISGVTTGQTSPLDVCEDDEDLDEDEGIFDMDL